ncbi:isochorismatase family protein [Pseudorhodoferax sp.]|uniref:isochorismatase family protein n=1 Tax=Pseudorhodoferax sp. TaxID=1993553 RepID=UPI0039E63BB3
MKEIHAMVVNPKLQPSDAVVVFADVQTGIVNLPLTVEPARLLRSVQGLARLAELFDLPTLALTIPKRGGGEPEVVPQITQVRSRYQHLQRTTPDSFENTAIRDALSATGRRTLIVCGIATEIVVHWLTLSGIANGYRVYVVVDACAGLGERSEAAAFRRFEAAGAVMSSVVSLAGELAGDMTQPRGRDAVEVVYQLVSETMQA